ncbi:hypothetical protein [Nocardiopsis sp. CC223A]|uniref:hypothetical protein n=1 Tax=Nocardiopsis sp. CC223A TaxID=3044051 RepID=UPI00278C52D6|nr:hypothetical protein [Nocardiopsis sp. CC223A]
MRLPWTLAGLTAVGGVLCGLAAVAHALIESERGAGFVGWPLGAVAMVLLTPMWLSLVGPLAGERPWSLFDEK